MAESHFFTPSNDSLVDGYLRARIDVGNICDHAMASLFHDADVCSARPHDLVRDHLAARVPCRDAGGGLQWFFFSPARFDGKSTTRRSRTIDGTNEKESWHSEGSSKPVEGSTGGYVQKFSYHVRTATGTVEKPGWIMAEYTFKNTRPGDVVLCKVYRSPRGPGRSNASSSSSTSSAKSGTKRKAADHGEAPRPSTRPRLDVGDEDDVVMFAEDIERDLLSRGGYPADDTAPELEETMQNVVESPHPEPQVAPAASVEGVDMTLQEMETLLMTDVEDDGTALRVPDGKDPVAFYWRFMDLLGDDKQHDDDIQQQDADIQTARGLLSEYDVITALAAGITVDELLLHGPSMSCPHPGGALGVVLCT